MMSDNYKMNQQEELIVKILSSVDIIQGKTKFVKILHLTCKLFEENQKESPFSFIPDRYGVYSPELEPVLQKLKSQRIVKISGSIFSKRKDLSLIDINYQFNNEVVLAMGLKIELIVQELNKYSSDEVVAISYDLFPKTTINSEIKPKVNKKITEMFSSLSSDFEESFEEKTGIKPISSEMKELYPRFNDMDARIHMMKSLGLEKLPEINPDVIDESTGLLAKKHPFFKKYNLEKMLEDARRR